MKKGLLFMVSALILAASLPTAASAKNVQASVDGCDGTRDAGQLIVYTDAYGDTTRTNMWGAEAIVGDDHRVTSVVRGNAEIPDGGFVVSGHDDEEEGGKKSKTWVYDNLAVGDYVYFDRRTFTLTVSDEPLDTDVSPFFSFDHTADGVNTSRGEDQMIIYTPARGATTGTNEYGYEVVVEDGVITKLGGNNSAIPQNGYVVSMHGSTAKWMRAKLVKGMTAEYNEKTGEVIFAYSADGVKKAVNYSLSQVKTAIAEAKDTFVYADFDAAQAALQAAEDAYQAALDAYAADQNDNAFADACDRLVEEVNTIENALCDSYTVQYRGVWVRPSQLTAKAVEDYVKELHDAGINLVCVEGWFANGVIMDVPEDSLFGRHPSFQYDVLQAYVDACHKYGMECHLWMPIMNVGSSTDSGYEERSAVGKKPEWLSLNNQGVAYNKDGFMMIDPANDEARAYLVDFYKYIVTTYDIDGFELDYIRYYAATDEVDYGYTEAAFAGFEKEYGYGVTPTYDPSAEYWDDWCQYRRDCITQWVRDIRAMLDKEAPDVVLGADVAFPFEHALDRVYQDFPSWLEEGLIDVLHPMAYGDGYGEDIQKAVALGGDRCMVVTGLGAHMDLLGAAELERQAREDNAYGAYGDCYFEAHAYLADKVAPVAEKTVYRNEAMPPFLDAAASLNAALDYLVGRIDDVIVPQGGMSDAQAATVKQAVEAAKAAQQNGVMTEKTYKALGEAIAAVDNENARAALEGDLLRAWHITRVKNGGSPSSTDAVQAPMPKAWRFAAIGAAVALGAAAVATVIAVIRRRKKK